MQLKVFKKFWPFDLSRLHAPRWHENVTTKLLSLSSKYCTAFEICYLIGQNHDTICKYKVHTKFTWTMESYQILYAIAKIEVWLYSDWNTRYYILTSIIQNIQEILVILVRLYINKSQVFTSTCMTVVLFRVYKRKKKEKKNPRKERSWPSIKNWLQQLRLD